jgi:hypothetical protein
MPKPSLSGLIRKYLIEVAEEFTGDDILTYCDQSGGFFAAGDTSKQQADVKKNIHQCLHRLAEKNEIARVRRGVYRRIDGDASDIQILDSLPDPLDLKFPLGLERYVRLYPGDLIVVAGAQNAGKTAFLLVFALLNWGLSRIRYQSSELGAPRLTRRLNCFEEVYGASSEDWRQHVEFKERSNNFTDLLHPGWINIIDYFEIEERFYTIAGPFRQFSQRLQQGIAVVGLQMTHGNNSGRGGSFSKEKPSLYLTLDFFQEVGLNRLVIEKAKDWADDQRNPNGLDFWFEIRKGCEFVLKDRPSKAEKLVAKARERSGK